MSEFKIKELTKHFSKELTNERVLDVNDCLRDMPDNFINGVWVKKSLIAMATIGMEYLHYIGQIDINEMRRLQAERMKNE